MWALLNFIYRRFCRSCLLEARRVDRNRLGRGWLVNTVS